MTDQKIQPTLFQRKPLYVGGVQVTATNFLEVARWCQGVVMNKDGSLPERDDTWDPYNFRAYAGLNPNEQFIQVDVKNPQSPRQARAHVGDWVLYNPKGGYKVYKDNSFRKNFFLVEDQSIADKEKYFLPPVDETEKINADAVTPTGADPTFEWDADAPVQS